MLFSCLDSSISTHNLLSVGTIGSYFSSNVCLPEFLRSFEIPGTTANPPFSSNMTSTVL